MTYQATPAHAPRVMGIVADAYKAWDERRLAMNSRAKDSPAKDANQEVLDKPTTSPSRESGTVLVEAKQEGDDVHHPEEKR